MNLGVIGAGYVGLVTGACLSERNHDVSVVEINPTIIEQLNRGKPHIFEPGLEEILSKSLAEGRIRFSNSISDAVSGRDAVFIAVGTPQNDDDRADMSQFFSAVEDMIPYVSDGQVIVNKSTVPVGTAHKVKRVFSEAGKDVYVVSNPETLAQGQAVRDFKEPSRIIIGADEQEGFNIMREIYRNVMRRRPRFIEMDPASAEVTKYACNFHLANRISTMNRLAVLCDATGANIDRVREGVGSDPRIGESFLFAGPGFAGGCFPKDVRALAAQFEDNGIDSTYVRSTIEANEQQRRYALDRIIDTLGDGKTVALWGLSFKRGTDDTRESIALLIGRELVKMRKRLLVHDKRATRRYLEEVPEAEPGSRSDILSKADLLVIQTDEPEYMTLDDEDLSRLQGKKIVDLRNLLSDSAIMERMEERGIEYVGIGIGSRL